MSEVNAEVIDDSVEATEHMVQEVEEKDEDRNRSSSNSSDAESWIILNEDEEEQQEEDTIKGMFIMGNILKWFSRMLFISASGPESLPSIVSDGIPIADGSASEPENGVTPEELSQNSVYFWNREITPAQNL